MPLDDALGAGRHRQLGQRGRRHLDRLALDRAGEGVFGCAFRQVFEAGDEQRRIGAVDDGDGAGLATLPVFASDDRAVPALVVELDGDAVGAVHLHAVDRGVDPAGVGIAHDHDGA